MPVLAGETRAQGLSWSCSWRRPEHRPRTSEHARSPDDLTRASLLEIADCAPRERCARASTWPRSPRWDSVHHVLLDRHKSSHGVCLCVAHATRLCEVRLQGQAAASQRHGGLTGNQITDASMSSTLLDLYPTTLKAHQHLLDAHKLARSLLDLCTRTCR